MGGDFNDFPPGPVTFTLRNRLHDAGARIDHKRTFPSRCPLLRLDRLYLSPRLQVVSTRVDRSPAFRAASDHLPIILDLDVPTPSLEGPDDPP